MVYTVQGAKAQSLALYTVHGASASSPVLYTVQLPVLTVQHGTQCRVPVFPV